MRVRSLQLPIVESDYQRDVHRAGDANDRCALSKASQDLPFRRRVDATVGNCSRRIRRQVSTIAVKSRQGNAPRKGVQNAGPATPQSGAVLSGLKKVEREVEIIRKRLRALCGRASLKIREVRA